MGFVITSLQWPNAGGLEMYYDIFLGPNVFDSNYICLYVFLCLSSRLLSAYLKFLADKISINMYMLMDLLSAKNRILYMPNVNNVLSAHVTNLSYFGRIERIAR